MNDVSSMLSFVSKTTTASENKKKTLLLIGGGHAHVQILIDSRFRTLDPDCFRVILLTESPISIYSGLLPASIVGLSDLKQAETDVQSLCHENHIHFIHGIATRVDANAKRVTFHNILTGISQSISYSILSINVGSASRSIPGTNLLPDSAFIATRPIAKIAPALDNFATKCRNIEQQQKVVVIGSGYAGIELALAVRAKIPTANITLIGSGKQILHAAGAQLRRADVTFLRGYTVTELQPRTNINVNNKEGDEKLLNDGCIGDAVLISSSPTTTRTKTTTTTADITTKVPFNLVILATGASPPPLLAQTDLPRDTRGWLLVSSKLCSLHTSACVFAAGDCITLNSCASQPVPKAGVFAVRQGPILAHNLYTSLVKNDGVSSGVLKDFVPQSNFLALLSTGDGRAIGTKYGISFTGTWVFRLKMYIDEAWQSRFRINEKSESNEEFRRKHEESFCYEGTPVEAAGMLRIADDVDNGDCFDVQLAILKKMDSNLEFRNAVITILDMNSNEKR